MIREPWLVAAALLTVLACGRAPRDTAAAPVAPAAPLAVRTVAVETAPGAPRHAPATVVARQRAALAARIPATVRALPFREGAAVRAGDVVVRLDDDALRSALAAADAERVAAQADRDRFARLLQRQAATPREAEDAESRAAAAQAAVAAARDALKYAVLRAPFSGRLARRAVREGDVVAPGQTLVELEGESGFELRAALDADAAAALVVGQQLTAWVDGWSAPIAATVRAVTPAADPGTHRFEVIADLAAPSGLRSGLYARLELPSGREPALAIPLAAAFARGGLTGVFVAEDGLARLRWIAPGESGGETLEVRAGLEPGERVILDPAGLTDGAPIAERR